MLRLNEVALSILLIFLAFVQTTSADPLDSFELSNSKVAYLPINSDGIYDLIDQNFSTLFFRPDKNMELERYLAEHVLIGSKPENAPTFEVTFQPNFFDSDRYWIVFYFENKTDITRWKLQISRFFIDEINIFLFDEETDRLVIRQHFSAQDENVDVNTLGRAIDIDLIPEKRYILGVELIADSPVNKPYIGLMSEKRYSKWSFRIELIYDIAFGFILAIVILTLSTGIIIRESIFCLFAISTAFLYGFLMMRGPLWGELFGLPYVFGNFVLIYGSATALILLLFAYKFLNITRSDKSFHKLFKVTFFLTIPIPFLVIANFLSDWWIILIYGINLFLFMSAILGAGIDRVLKTGSVYNILYIAGWLPVGWSLLSVVIGLLFPSSTPTKIGIDYAYLRETLWLLIHIFAHVLSLIIRVKEINDQAIRAQFLNQAKSNFIASSSHDLRQPLHSMQMYISALQEYTSEPKAKNLLDSLENTHRHMNQSFLSIMELSKLEAGAVKVINEHYALSDLFNKLRLEYSDVAKAKFIDLKIRGTHVVVNTDPLLLERILRNLINNAIKYTDSGKILVGARRKGQNVIIKVYDTGEGIPKNKQEQIFDIYSRLSHTADGTGIGLSIVKHMAELLNHKVAVESEVGRGTVFSIELPRVEETISSRVAHLPIENTGLLEFTLLSKDQAVVEHLSERFQILEGKIALLEFRLNPIADFEQLKTELPGTLLVDSAVFDTSQQLIEFAKEQKAFFSSVVIIDSDKYPLRELKQHRILVVPKDLKTIQVRALISYAEKHVKTAKQNTLNKGFTYVS